ncbi:hypothetical protein K493DRAFT_404114 [Basidiobolus meristosporus CBS 931.73]|uniref:Uncharacterized protein n=1 Tax=Basidiobolus meristosporus CBS 931.73 TaxID=1314790 RepID=A0A1Y1Z7G4_9FUNG|nr:hypothetical protein K493DRAFT_404114 [Basidiobolus meristosporus CBS 931.73]|eukprot:ORY06209.1 hypothetical protein K493DRAFT_404114 [Basidiobolus meristosporus CBS 931.73]
MYIQICITCIFFPILIWAFKRAISLVEQKRSIGYPKRPVTRAEVVANYLVLAVVAYQLYYSCSLYYSSNDIFRTLGVHPNVPNYQLRNRFRDYAANRSSVDYDFELNSNFKLSDYKNRYELVQDPSSFNRMYGLVQLLYIKDNRLTYNKFGEFAFLNCIWCQNPNDYIIFNLPEILGSYILVGITLGFATIFKRKEPRRTYGVTFLLALGIVETSLLIDQQQFHLEDFMLQFGNFHEVVQIFRRVSFAFLLSLVYLFNNSEDIAPIVLVQRALAMNEVMLYQVQALKIQHAAVFGDSDLRALLDEYHKSKEQITEAVKLQPVYQEAHSRVLEKHDLQKLTKDSEAIVSRIITDATTQPASPSSKKDV